LEREIPEVEQHTPIKGMFQSKIFGQFSFSSLLILKHWCCKIIEEKGIRSEICFPGVFNVGAEGPQKISLPA